MGECSNLRISTKKNNGANEHDFNFDANRIQLFL